MRAIFELFGFLARTSREMKLYRTFFLVVLTGGISGLGGAALIVLINSSVNAADGPMTQLIWLFAGLTLLVSLTGFLSQSLVAVLSARAVFELRVKLARSLLDASVRQLEKIGADRIYAHLTNDVQTISGALADLPVICLNTFIIAGCVSYLAWLSISSFGVVLVLFAVGVLAYRLPMAFASRRFSRVRRFLDQLFGHFRGLVLGSKELKLHRERRSAFLERDFVSTAKNIRRDSAWAAIVLAGAHWADFIVFFAGLGFFVFALPQLAEVEREVVTGYVLTFLYMRTALSVVLGRFTLLTQSLVSVRRIEELEAEIGPTSEGGVGESAGLLGGGSGTWSELVLDGVAHQYRREQEDDSFMLGPIDMRLQAGELVFIVGGNGSGKTTLAKLLVGLYSPEGGRILLDGREVNDENRDAYRQMFSVVFSDFFLFETLLGLRSPDLDERAQGYLRALHLERKVTVSEGRLSTLDLSQGQRKRLALLTAYLEDRPIYLFDEWAADQDPEFKRVFYRQILPDLKARGKTVVCISHDDRYFDVADRVLKLENGGLASRSPVVTPALETV